MDGIPVDDPTRAVLDSMLARGFDEAQATTSWTRQDEVNINLNEPSLMRSVESRRLALAGIVEGRKASTELSDLRDDAVREAIAALRAAAAAAPRDPANKVSSGQRARIVQGPQEANLDLLAEKVSEMLDFRARETPLVMIDEAFVAHTLARSHTLTSGGTDLQASVGCHSMSLFGTARDGKDTSSFAETSGTCDALEGRHASDLLGIAELLRDLERQVRTRRLDSKFVGEVVLGPQAVSDLVKWLLGQVGDVQLIAGNSLYKDRVGQAIASPRLTVRSRFDAPGVCALSADAFVAPPVELLREGVLRTLTPSLYGSLKTGLAHVPTAMAGWEMLPGDEPRSKLVSAVARGALVGRLSMGNPAPNGDFSGVIKNSFYVENGEVGAALSETMISGNVGRMLRDVLGVSRERIDTGAFLLPWLRIGNLSFS